MFLKIKVCYTRRVLYNSVVFSCSTSSRKQESLPPLSFTAPLFSFPLSSYRSSGVSRAVWYNNNIGSRSQDFPASTTGTCRRTFSILWYAFVVPYPYCMYCVRTPVRWTLDGSLSASDSIHLIPPRGVPTPTATRIQHDISIFYSSLIDDQGAGRCAEGVPPREPRDEHANCSALAGLEGNGRLR